MAGPNNFGFVADDAPSTPSASPSGSGNFGFVADPMPGPEDGGIVDTAVKGLQAAGKGLDYARGMVGAPIEAGILKATTGKNPLTMKEYLHGINPTNLDTVPGGNELMKRAGVPEGYSLADATKWLPGVGGPLIQKGDPMDITLRGAGGFGADAITDPLSWLSFGASAAAKEGGETWIKKLPTMPGVKQATMVSNAPSALTSATGKKLFSWGVTPIEQAGERYGKDAVADTMYKYGIKGSGNQIESKMADVAGKLKDTRDAILKAADDAGSTVNREDAFKGFTDTLQEMTKNRRLSPEEADKIHEAVIGSYMHGEDPSTALATLWKSDMYKSLPQKVWETTKNPSLGQALNRKASGGLKSAIEQTVDHANPGQGKVLADTNDELGKLLSVSPATSKYADMLERKPLLSQWDMAAGVGGGLFSDNPAKGALMVGAKKLLEIGKMPYVRTNVGSALRTIGEGSAAPYLDTLTMQALKRGLKKPPASEEK